jgi:hypothetical protein
MHYNLLFDHTRDQGSLYFAVYIHSVIRQSTILRTLIQTLDMHDNDVAKRDDAAVDRFIAGFNTRSPLDLTFNSQMHDFIRNTARFHKWLNLLFYLQSRHSSGSSTFTRVAAETIINNHEWTPEQKAAAKANLHFDEFTRWREMLEKYYTTNMREEQFDIVLSHLQESDFRFFATHLFYHYAPVYNYYMGLPTLTAWTPNSVYPLPLRPTAAAAALPVPPLKFQLTKVTMDRMVTQLLNESNLPVQSKLEVTTDTEAQLYDLGQIINILFNPNMAYTNPDLLAKINTTDVVNALRTSFDVTDSRAKNVNMQLALLLFSKLGFTRQLVNGRWELESYDSWLSFIKKALDNNTPHPLFRIFPVTGDAVVNNFLTYVGNDPIKNIMEQIIKTINETSHILHRSYIVDKTEIVESYKRNSQNIRYMRNMILKSDNVPPFIKGEGGSFKPWYAGMLNDVPNGFAFQFKTTPRTEVTSTDALRNMDDTTLREKHRKLLEHLEKFKLDELTKIHNSLRAEYYTSSAELKNLNYSIVKTQRKQIEKYLENFDANKEAIVYQINYLQRYLALMNIFWDYYDPHIFAEFDFNRVLEVLDERLSQDYTSGVRIANMLESIDNTITNHFKTQINPIA